jgi:hypothetical protein
MICLPDIYTLMYIHLQVPIPELRPNLRTRSGWPPAWWREGREDCDRYRSPRPRRGITFYDNSWEYYHGKTESWLGLSLKGRRDKVFLMTKVCTHGRDASLARLNKANTIMTLCLFLTPEGAHIDPLELFTLLSRRGAMCCGVSEQRKWILRCSGNFTSPRGWGFVFEPSSSRSSTTQTSAQHPNQPTIWPIDTNVSQQPWLRRRQRRLQPPLTNRRPAFDPAGAQTSILSNEPGPKAALRL